MPARKSTRSRHPPRRLQDVNDVAPPSQNNTNDGGPPIQRHCEVNLSDQQIENIVSKVTQSVLTQLQPTGAARQASDVINVPSQPNRRVRF